MHGILVNVSFFEPSLQHDLLCSLGAPGQQTTVIRESTYEKKIGIIIVFGNSSKDKKLLLLWPLKRVKFDFFVLPSNECHKHPYSMLVPPTLVTYPWPPHDPSYVSFWWVQITMPPFKGSNTRVGICSIMENKVFVNGLLLPFLVV